MFSGKGESRVKRGMSPENSRRIAKTGADFFKNQLRKGMSVGKKFGEAHFVPDAQLPEPKSKSKRKNFKVICQ